MDIKNLNETFKSLLNEDINEAKEDFLSILKQAMERISNNSSTEQDINILNDLNKTLIKNQTLSSDIYNIILNSNTDVVNNLINGLKGTKTYSDIGEEEVDTDDFQKELQTFLGNSLYKELKKEGELFIADFSGGYMRFPKIMLYLEDNKLKVTYGGSSKQQVLYIGNSVKDCKQVIEDKLINNKFKIFSLCKAFLYIAKSHPDKLRWPDDYKNIK